MKFHLSGLAYRLIREVVQRGVRITGSVESGEFGLSPESIISSCMILGLSYLTFFSLRVLICITIIKLK